MAGTGKEYTFFHFCQLRAVDLDFFFLKKRREILFVNKQTNKQTNKQKETKKKNGIANGCVFDCPVKESNTIM